MPVADLPSRHAALNFLFPRAFQYLLGHNWVQVAREAAKDAANAFNSLVFRGEGRVRARRFSLWCLVAIFAENSGWRIVRRARRASCRDLRFQWGVRAAANDFRVKLSCDVEFWAEWLDVLICDG